ERFKKYIPPPEVKIAVGDVVSVIIWEAAANGLFGNSLAEWSVPPGVASQLLGTATRGTGALSTAGQSLATSSNEILSQLLGGAAAGLTALPGQDLSGAAAALAGPAGEGLGAAALALSGLAAQQPTQGTATAGTAGTVQPRMPGVPSATTSRNLQELLQYATETGRPGTRIPDQQ